VGIFIGIEVHSSAAVDRFYGTITSWPDSGRLLKLNLQFWGTEMYVQNAKINKTKSALLAALLAVLTLPAFASIAREQKSRSRLSSVQEFLWAIYPRLNGKGYALSVEIAFRYDQPLDDPTEVNAYVGAGSKFAVLGCCVGGRMGGTIPGPTLPPSDLDSGQVPLPPSSPVPSSTPPSSPVAPSEEVDSEGRIRPRQYLHVHFVFDKSGAMTDFNAEGPEITNRERGNKLYSLVQSNPKITDEEVISALKTAGAKYGPRDREQFIKDLPTSALERFLDKLELNSAQCSALDENRNNLALWPLWEVQMLATRADGSKHKYRMIFEPFEGSLVGLSIDKSPIK